MLTEDEKNKLWLTFREIKDPKLAVFAANTFYTACYLHRIGQVAPSIKLLTSMFNYLGRHRKAILIKKVFRYLDSNELELAECVPANVEVKRLFK